jgi:hypothetical protein
MLVTVSNCAHCCRELGSAPSRVTDVLCIYVCMYVKGVGQDYSYPCTATCKINCTSSSCLFLSGLSLSGRHGRRLVPWSNVPGDEILSKLLPHNYIGYGWLIPPFLGTFCIWYYLLVLLGDSFLGGLLLHILLPKWDCLLAVEHSRCFMQGPQNDVRRL